MPSPIRIAIIGGGVAGASLIHALMKHPHLDVHIFESATEFKEAGMAFGIARNAQAALELMGPEAGQFLKRAGAVPMKGVRIMFAQGEAAGKAADEIDEIGQGKRLTSIVHRVAFLQELLANVPRDRMHASKKLQKIDRNDSVTLYFTDGTTHECDILVGADGIHSTVRKLVLGESDPAASPQRNGAWFLMTLQPFDKAQASLGQELIDMENPSSFVEEARPSNNWQRKVSADEIKELFRDFPPQLNEAIIELLCNQPEHNALYLWDHPNAHTYVNGPICVTGDAAHSTTPWQGSGGGMTIEDSLILSTLLGCAKSSTEALTALKVYDQFRRPRTQQIVESSRTIGTMLMGVNKDAGLDPAKFKSFLSRWDFIIDIDMEKHRDEALRAMKDELKA
ncbi:hypothetical protein ABKA04_001866 [Annulohypoxylon sp. FPYF3050]